VAVADSKDFELDVAEYVEEAYERCGLEVRTGYDLKTAKRSLNLMLADWANRGLNQWTIKQTTIITAQGIGDYPAGNLNITVGASGSFSAATAKITNLPSSTSMAITIPTGTFSNGETLTGGTSGATTTLSAAVDLTPVQSTIDVLSAVIRRDTTDYGITRISRDAYLNIPSKTQQARASQFFIDRQITPVLKVWPIPENSTDSIIFDRLVRMDDSDTYTNTMDLPFRFYPCLAAGLAYYLAIKKAPDRIQLLKAVYEEEFERAAAEDRDRASSQVQPSLAYMRLR